MEDQLPGQGRRRAIALLAGCALLGGTAGFFAGSLSWVPAPAAAVRAVPGARPGAAQARRRPQRKPAPVASRDDAAGQLAQLESSGGASLAGDAAPAPNPAPAARLEVTTAAAAPEEHHGPMPLSIWVAGRSAGPIWRPGEPFAQQGPVAERKGWNPDVAREQLIGLLPAGAVEDVTRPFVERRIQVKLQREEASVTLRIPID